MAVLNLSTEQLDGLLSLAAMCKGDRHPLDSLLDVLLDERLEAVD